MKIRRLAHALGAEVLDVDLSAALEPATFRAIRQAWIEHLVLVFPGQDRLTPDAHVAFSRLFGTLDRSEVTPSYRLPGYEEVIEITNRPTAAGVPSPSRDVGRRWHSDLDFTLQPTMGSLLWCGQLPEVGGDTMFANMYLAFETLSPALQRTLEGMHAVYDVMAGVRAQDGRDAAALEEMRTASRPVAQPLVKVHPESGRKALFLSERAVRFEGWTREESQPLIAWLCRHATEPELVFRKQWRMGDLVIWDNRCTLHQALGDYDRSQVRYMRRTAIVGEPSGRLVQET